MANAYFKIVATPTGFGIKFFPATDGGSPLELQEVLSYLDSNKITYDLASVKQSILDPSEHTLTIGVGECPRIRENYKFSMSEDFMTATARFYPPSDTGERMSESEFLNDLSYKQIKFGIQNEIITRMFSSGGIYCTDLVVAKGQPPRHGTDAKIEYFFNTDLRAKPELNEDGTVNFFNLNLVNPVTAGQELARITPADPGDPGTTITGAPIKPRDVKTLRHEFGKNITLSEDRLSIYSDVNGLVTLTGGSVFVSNVYEVENVDTSTGNIDFVGNVQVNGNIATNFQVKATGDVIVKGVVEGANVEAGGNIIIARGMNGMSKGVLRAGNNIVAKFIENATVSAAGYVHTESILHSNVVSGAEIVVSGKKGFITGGRVQAESTIECRTLGAVMGASTVVEVGVNPELKAEFIKLQKEVAEIVQAIKTAQPVIQNFMEKKAKGVRFTADQLAYVRQQAASLETNKTALTEKNARMQEISAVFDPSKKAEVLVSGEVYPGTTIIIGDSSMNVKDSYQYCRFVRKDGEVRMAPL